MRITRKTLIQLAEREVLKRTQQAHDLEAVYLIGSVATQEAPLLGGSADIDLVFIHRQQPAARHERVGISPDIHLDIIHRATREYEPLRELRTNAQLAPELYAPQVLFKSGFFFDRLQAALLSAYAAPPNTLARARQFLAAGRDRWLELQFSGPSADPGVLGRYLEAAGLAANALVALDNRPPLGERRFLPELARRANALHQETAYADFLRLLCAQPLPPTEELADWIKEWEAAWQAAIERKPPFHRLHPARRNYYLGGFRALLADERPHDLLWPLLLTWTQAVSGLADDQPQREAWAQALHRLGLLEDNFPQQIAALDAFLDQVDILLETYENQIEF